MISIVIPAHNGANFLDAAIASIEAQQFPDREVLLVDDGSTEELPRPAFVRYFRQPRQGPSAARNRGIRESRGKLIAFLDIDDTWAPGHLSRLDSVLQAHPDAGIAQGRMRQLSGDRISGPYRMPYIGSCLFRREVFDICGGFDETMKLGEDYDLIFRCWEKDIVKIHVDDVSLIYRRHDSNITRGNHQRSHMIVMKRRLERIRAGAADPGEKRRFPFQDYIGDTGEAGNWTLWPL
jgi:glycosyltransferase involved in cell wall biosynthesis